MRTDILQDVPFYAVIVIQNGIANNFGIKAYREVSNCKDTDYFYNIYIEKKIPKTLEKEIIAFCFGILYALKK